MATNLKDRKKILIAESIKQKEQLFKEKMCTKAQMWEEILKEAKQENLKLKKILKVLKKQRPPLTPQEFYYLDEIKIIKQIKEKVITKRFDAALHHQIISFKTESIDGLDVYFFTIEDKYLWRVQELAKIELSNNRVFVFKFIKKQQSAA